MIPKEIYKVWTGIKQRCFNPKSRGYHNYGGRGITMCREWADSFVDFAAAVGPRPSPYHSIDRIDNDGNYEPGNVRWADSKTQRRNSRSASLTEVQVRQLLHYVLVEGWHPSDMPLLFPISAQSAYNIARGYQYWLPGYDYPKNIPRRKNAEQYRGGAKPKLTATIVATIRNAAAAGVHYATLAEEYRISPSHVANIISRRVWKGVD